MKTDFDDKPRELKSRSSRRQFLKAIVAGAAGAILLPSVITLAKGDAEALLLSCMDYRLINKTARYMNKRGLKNKYDHIILPGAALGAITDKQPSWNKTFWEELDLAIELHHVQKVILLDHRDCGAYKQFLGEDFAQKPVEETKIHSAQSHKLGEMINERYAKLEIETLLMNLNGAVEKI